MARKSKKSDEPSLFATFEAEVVTATTSLEEPPAGGPQWTKQQQAVIEHIEGDLLVSAAAGSGKTAVLAERCARLVTTGTDVDRLLVLTFTEAAAAEMRTRIAEAIRKNIAAQQDADLRTKLFKQNDKIERASISTLHAFCARTLRNYFHDVGVDPAFEIFDEEEARLLRDEVLDDVLARYHQLPPSDPLAAAFTDFYEAYGQGSENAVKGFIGAVHAMTASVKDPAQWLADARDAYSESGSVRLLDAYTLRVADQLDLLAARCARNIAFLRHEGMGDMADALIGFGDLMRTAAHRLKQEKSAAWSSVSARIGAFYFPSVRRPEDFSADLWERNRDFTLYHLKDKLKNLTNFTFALPREKMLGDLRSLAAPLDVLIRMTLDFQAAYSAVKLKQNRLDFSDLERLTLDLLCRADSPAREELRRRFDHIMVDESQDINPLQEALLEALRSPDKHHGRGNLFVVGDIKQSIYGFRLAEPRLFARREMQYRALTSHTAYITLQNNFRSLPPLLKNMNAVFSRLLTQRVAGIDYADGHQLHPPERSDLTAPAAPIELHIVQTDLMPDDEPEDDTGDNRKAKEDIVILSSAEREAEMVAQRIVELMRENRSVTRKSGQSSPLRYGDIAILLRGMKNRAHIFARKLAEANIPVHADLSTGYFDAQEVRDVLSLLETLDNPLQDIPLAATLLGRFGRFTHDDVARIRLAYSDKHQVPFHMAVPRYIPEHSADCDVDGNLAARLQAFFDMLARYRAIARSHPLHEALAEIYQDSGITIYLSGLPAGQQRVANLQMLHQRALQFSGFRKQGLYRFLKFIERLRQADGDFGEAPVLSEAADVVRIMSIHKSKGLEFPVVFTSSLGTNFNLQNGGPVQVHRDLHIALQVADVERNIFYHSAASKSAQLEAQRFARAEELRLLYVAMTRARDHLILTGTAKANTVAAARERWKRHTGPLPEDLLLEGRRFLDWLLPIAASAELGALWPGDKPRAAPLVITVHENPPVAVVSSRQVIVQDPLVAKLLARQPMSAPPDAVVQALIDRLEGRYKYAALTAMAALSTVSELKKRDQNSGEIEDPALPSLQRVVAPQPLATPYFAVQKPVDSIQSFISDPYVQRGIATHRLLEVIDFAAVKLPQDIPAQVDQLISSGKIARDQAALVHLDDIAWFLFEQSLGQQLRDISQSNLQDATRVLREVPFICTMDPRDLPAIGDPLDATVVTSALDRPQIRGIIDVLLVSPTEAEIIDYKTDHASAVDSRLPMYRTQMHYYQRAAAAILGRPVPVATLIFLSARRIEVVG